MAKITSEQIFEIISNSELAARFHTYLLLYPVDNSSQVYDKAIKALHAAVMEFIV